MSITPGWVPHRPHAQLPPSEPGLGTHPWLCLDVLPQEPLLVQGVPGLPCNGVDGAFVNLLFDCTDQEEEGFANCLLGEGGKTQ